MDRLKILVMGLPGAGKTTLAKAIVARLGAVHLNADEMRANINKDLGFSLPDRLEQARRMGWLSDRMALTGTPVVADFVCPTPEARELFGDAFIIWLDRIVESRFADTNQLFTPPERYDVRVGPEGAAEEWAERICEALRPEGGTQGSAFLIVDGQAFGEAERSAVARSIDRHGHVCILVKEPAGNGKEHFAPFVARIETLLSARCGRFRILRAHDISDLRVNCGTLEGDT